MKTRILVFAGIAFLAAAAAVPLAAQSLLDNEFYHKAQALLIQSQQALDGGDYDTSATLASEARDNLAKSNDYVVTMQQFYRANGYLSMAKDRITFAKSIDADTRYKTAYDTAVTAVADAKTALDGKDYPKSIDLSKSAIAALENIARVAKTPPVETPRPTVQGPMPQYYTWKWRLLYDANKDLLADPKNPDIIEPGMRFLIPSLGSETRDGDFDPQAEYPPLAAK